MNNKSKSSLTILIILGIILAFVAIASTSFTNKDDKPLVFALQKQKKPEEIKENADALAKVLSESLNREVQVIVPGNYSATVQAIVSKHADVGYMSSLPFLLAERDGNAKLLLAEARPDQNGDLKTSYDSIIVAKADSEIKSWDDITKNASNLRLVYTSHTSTSGYVFPFSHFRKTGLLKPEQKAEDVFKKVTYAGGYSQALQQVIAGNADIAAVSHYTMEGPSADIYLDSEKREQLNIVTRIAGVPTHVIVLRDGLSQEIEQEISESLLNISENRPELLKDVYGAAKLVPVKKDDHVKATREAISLTGLPIKGLTK